MSVQRVTITGSVSRVTLVSQAVTGPQGTSGTGGDMMKADNLSGLSNYTTARSNLGLGTAATTAATAYATAAQGATADTAVQPGDLGTAAFEDVGAFDAAGAAAAAQAASQPLDADLTDIAAIADVQGDILVRGAAGWERLAKSATATDVLTAGASQPGWAAASGGGGGIGSASAKTSGGTYSWTIPGCVQTGIGAYFTLTANTTTYGRIVVAEDRTIIAAGCFTNGAGGDVYLGLYEADEYWQPGALVSAFGTVSFASSGHKAITGLSVAIPAGRYLTAAHSKGGGQIYGYNACPVTGMMLESTPPSGLQYLRASETIAALPSTGTTWTAFTNWGPHLEYNGVYFRMD